MIDETIYDRRPLDTDTFSLPGQNAKNAKRAKSVDYSKYTDSKLAQSIELRARRETAPRAGQKFNKRLYWRLSQSILNDIEKALTCERSYRGAPSLAAADIAREALEEWLAVRGYLTSER